MRPINSQLFRDTVTSQLVTLQVHQHNYQRFEIGALQSNVQSFLGLGLDIQHRAL